MHNESIDVLDHLLQVYMRNLIRKTIKSDPTRNKYGFLPKMATASKDQIGTWLASSFCERFNLVANQVVTKENYLLYPDEIDMLKLFELIKNLKSL